MEVWPEVFEVELVLISGNASLAEWTGLKRSSAGVVAQQKVCCCVTRATGYCSAIIGPTTPVLQNGVARKTVGAKEVGS